jgi:Kelch motif protein
MNSVSSLRIKLSLALIIALLAVRDTAAQTLRKIELTGTKPSARFNHAVVNAGGKVFLFGGFNINPSSSAFHAAGNISPQGLFNDIWQFNEGAVQFDEIIPVNQGPGPLSSFSATAFENKMVVLFGSTPTGFNNNISVYDPAANTWTIAPPSGGEVPPGRVFSAAVSDNKAVYTIGGLVPKADVETGLNDLWVFDPTTKKWFNLAPMPGDFHGGAVASTEDLDIWRFGGEGKPLTGEFSGDGLVYNDDFNQWKPTFGTVPNAGGIVPQAGETAKELLSRAFMAYAQVGNTLYLFGGRGKNFQLFDDIIKIELKEDNKFTIKRLDVRFPAGLSNSSAAVLRVTPVAGLDAASLQTVEILIFGGISRGRETNDTFIFTDTVDIAGLPLPECTGGPTVSNISIDAKTKIKGKGFIEGLSISVNGVGFAKPPLVTPNKVTQKGKLTNGQSAAEACASGCEFKIANGDGKCTKVAVP